MRIWDIEPKHLCTNHLAAEHRELHAVWTVLTQNKTGYSRHPETLRWQGKLAALFNRHKLLVKEFKRRNWNHNSPLDKRFAQGKKTQDILIDPLDKQKKLLKNKPCGCLLP